jgi:outer membrane protein OmpA-like peptidoglycan-associated protein/opacity protein-like surface antigen
MRKCILVIGAAALFAWTAAAQEYPRVQTFLGYDYVRFNSSTNFPAFNLNGGGGQFSYNFNRWLSGVIDLGAVTNNSIGFTNPLTGAFTTIDNTQIFFMGGPRFTYRRAGRFMPYVQAVFGGAYYTASASLAAIEPTTLLPLTVRLQGQQTKFAMAIGGGLDIKLTRAIYFRPFQGDYYYTRFENLREIGDNNQGNFRAMAGFSFNFGGEKPAPVAQAMKTCPDGRTVPANQPCPKANLTLSLTPSATEVCPGETVQITPSIGGANPNQVGYQWSVNGQPIAQSPTFAFGTAGRDPGTYTISLVIGGSLFNPASAKTEVTVKPYVAPTGNVTASPAQVYVGEKSSIAATCNGQCGGPLQPPRLSASEGTISGDQFDSTGVFFDPSQNGEQRKTVTITAACADNKNVGTATTQVEVIKKASIAPIRLPDVLFSHNSSRVNNCGKRVLLEQLRAYYEKDSGGSVVLVGHQAPGENAANLSEQRAMNAAAVITAGTGVCLSIPSSQVQVSAPGTDQQGVSFDPGFCGGSVGGGANVDQRRVVVWFVPSGGQMPSSVTNAQPASALPVSSLGCPK